VRERRADGRNFLRVNAFALGDPDEIVALKGDALLKFRRIS
jgi:hypothetical protein